MTDLKVDRQITALVLIDPCNDFISEGGKIWPRIKDVAETKDRVPHILHLLNAVRKTELGIFFALHHRYRSFLISRINRRSYGNVESRTKTRSSDHEGRTN